MIVLFVDPEEGVDYEVEMTPEDFAWMKAREVQYGYAAPAYDSPEWDVYDEIRDRSTPVSKAHLPRIILYL